MSFFEQIKQLYLFSIKYKKIFFRWLNYSNELISIQNKYLFEINLFKRKIELLN